MAEQPERTTARVEAAPGSGGDGHLSGAPRDAGDNDHLRASGPADGVSATGTCDYSLTVLMTRPYYRRGSTRS